MKEQFTIINNENYDASTSDLIFQIGGHYIAYSILSKDNDRTEELKWFSVDEAIDKDLKLIIEENQFSDKTFASAKMIIDNSINFLNPSSHIIENGTSLLYLSGANQQDIEMQEIVSGWQLMNTYTIPYKIKNLLQEKLPAATFRHIQTRMIEHHKGIFPQGFLWVHFTDRNFIVICKKNHQLLLSQQYEFSTVEDVLFYLLKICDVFELKQEELELKLSGFIDKASKLYQQLYLYFLKIDWLQVDNPSVHPSYPNHMFSILNAASS